MMIREKKKILYIFDLFLYSFIGKKIKKTICTVFIDLKTL